MPETFLAPPKTSPVTSNVLKLIAIITMMIDHIGFVIFPQYRFLRAIGRIAFPIFIFMLVEGFYYTHDRRFYLLRLFVFSWISEVPFDLGLYGEMVHPQKSNVFFTLCIGFVVMLLANFLFSADTRKFRFPAISYGALLGIMA
ncbi:MAG: hypothetical protein IJ679_01485 [Lachnospiraceae bacterium]|nr:hypothetical protein [Lachnospiraceae bacterium]